MVPTLANGAFSVNHALMKPPAPLHQRRELGFVLGCGIGNPDQSHDGGANRIRQAGLAELGIDRLGKIGAAFSLRPTCWATC
jgi:hypothetical protein